MRKIAYLAMDLHARNFTLGEMDVKGRFIGNREFRTNEKNIIQALESVNAKHKLLTIEEGPLTYWAAQIAHSCVDQVVPCDSRENALIYKSPYKKDKMDTRDLCRLLRLGELVQVYHPANDDRAIFKAAARHYIDLRNQLTRFKQKIKAMYRYWGIIDIFTNSIYTSKGRIKYLQQVKHRSIRKQLLQLYDLMDRTEGMRQSALKDMKRLGRNYPEIREFMKIPGIFDVHAHIYNAFIQTPHRFSKISQLWRYCRLSITDRSSDGKPLGFKRLDPSGIGELKALSYRAFVSAMRGDNEIKRYYKASLNRSHDRKHARLNTQRKILETMYVIWKKGVPYRPELFSEST